MLNFTLKNRLTIIEAMNQTISFYRKEYPSETIYKLAPILSKVGGFTYRRLTELLGVEPHEEISSSCGLLWHQIVGKIQPSLKEKGIEIRELGSDNGFTLLLFTDEKETV